MNQNDKRVEAAPSANANLPEGDSNTHQKTARPDAEIDGKVKETPDQIDKSRSATEGVPQTRKPA